MKISVKRTMSFALALMLMASTLVIPAEAAEYNYSVGMMHEAPTITEDSAIKTDGSIWGWGKSSLVAEYADATNGYVDYRSTPTKANAPGDFVTVGDDWGITEGGALWGWSYLAYSAGAVDYTTTSQNPIKIMDDVAEFSGMWGKTERAYLAIKSDGTLVGWGTPSTLTGVDNYTDISAQDAIVLATDVKQVVTSDMYWMMVKNDGSLWACGFNFNGFLTAPIGGADAGKLVSQIKLMENVAAISMQDQIALVIKEDGTLWSWGENTYGQRGSGEARSNEIPAPAKIMEDVVYAKSLWYTSFAITKDGTLYGWGNNTYNQLGFDGGNHVTSDANYQTTPVPVAADVVAVAGGPVTTIILKSDGSVWSCGSNGAGYCGVPESQSMARGTSYYVPEWTKILDGVAMPGTAVSGTMKTPPTPPPSNAAFTDTAGHWANEYIQKAVDNGLVSGTGNGKFNPEQTVSYAEWAAMIVNLMGYKATTVRAEGYWWSEALCAAVENGAFDGTPFWVDTKMWSTDYPFTAYADKPISRYDMAMVIRNIGISEGWGKEGPENMSSSIADWSNISGLYRDSVSYSFTNSFITGVDSNGTFDGSSPMTRAAAATVLCRLLDAKTADKIR